MTQEDNSEDNIILKSRMNDKSKIQRYSWTEDNLRLAIEAVKKNELNIRQSSIKYGIPAKTLSRRLESGVLTKYSKHSGSRLGYENEQELVNYIKSLESTGYIHTRLEIRKIAYDYAKKKGLEHIFDQTTSLAGPYWLESFLRKYPDVKVRNDKKFDNANSTDNVSNDQDADVDNDGVGEIDQSYEIIINDEEDSKVMDFTLEFEDDVPEEEKNFYMKFYPTIDNVITRKIHCTVCDAHIGTAPCQESLIRMHPVMKVTHCKKCHEFYNSGEFSKGEDGSELYCRWCGQGGEVYCCSKCPYVFCKNCIILNLSQNIINDIEENENWNCFVCAPKIMWPLRAQHWALMNFIEKQKKFILSKNCSDSEIRKLMIRDQSVCCGNKNPSSKRPSSKLSGNVSESSCGSDNSITFRKRRTDKKCRRILPKQLLSDSDSCEEPPEPKKQKLNNEVVCTPDVLSMLQTENSLTNLSQKPTPAANGKPVKTPKPTVLIQQKSAPKVSQNVQRPPQKRPVQTQNTNIRIPAPQSSAAVQTHSPQQQPPPLIIRSYNGPLRAVTPTVVTRKTIVGSRPTSTSVGHTPVYHTINGFRIDLNSAAQQETFRLPNGKLIQVKRQGTTPSNINPMPQMNAHASTALNSQMIRTHLNSRAPQPQTIVTQQGNQTVQQITLQQPPQLATIRYSATPSQTTAGNTTITATIPTQSGTVVLNGSAVQQITRPVASNAAQPPTLTRQFFSATPLGQARLQLQTQIFTAMEQCQYLGGKIHSLTNSNAYKGVKSFTDVKELYIHLSYLFTYAIGRFKSLQEKCVEDMRKLGFAGDAATLQTGQSIKPNKSNNDADDDDIEIVEPKTTCIDLDSDNEDGQSASAKRNTTPAKTQQITSKQSSTPSSPVPTSDSIPANKTSDDDLDLTARLLAGLLEVELHEGDEGSEETREKAGSPSESSNGGISCLKKPRKKITNKPNPHLIKQMELQQREGIQEIIRSDTKLSSECSVVLEKIDDSKYDKTTENFDIEEEIIKTSEKKENEYKDKQEANEEHQIETVKDTLKSIDDMKTPEGEKQSYEVAEFIVEVALDESDKNSNLEEFKISQASIEPEEIINDICPEKQTINSKDELLDEAAEKRDMMEDEDETSNSKEYIVVSTEDGDVEMEDEILNEEKKAEKGRKENEEVEEEEKEEESKQAKLRAGKEEEQSCVENEKESEEVENRKEENGIEDDKIETEGDQKDSEEEEEHKASEKEEEPKEKQIENIDDSIMNSIKTFDIVDESSKTQDSFFESISDTSFDVTESLSTAEIENCLQFNEESGKNDNFFMESSLVDIALDDNKTLNIDDNAVQCETENI